MRKTMDQSNTDVDADSRTKLMQASGFHLAHWLVIALSVILTFGAWYIAKDQLNQKIEAKFNREALHIVELVKDRMKLYENALWGAVALIDANQSQMTYPQWRVYADSLNIDKVYPGINGIGVIYNIKTPQMADYLARERIARPNYSLHPARTGDEYWPITYVEPTTTNQKAIGLDMAFETNRYTGIKKARDTGKAQLTGPITLVQDAKKTPGFLFYTPFYRQNSDKQTTKDRQKNILGVTYAPFIMSKLMQGTLASQNRHVGIKITDASELLFEDSPNTVEYDANPLFKKNVEVSLYGRTWFFEMQSDKKFRKATSSNQPAWILIGGIIIDCLLLSLFIFLTRANRKALAYADQTTLKLQHKTKNLEKSNHDLEQFSYIASHDLKSPLNSINQLATWIEEDSHETLAPESLEHLQLLKARCARMMKLLNDLLAYSRINKNEYPSEIINLYDMSKDIFHLLDAPQGFTFSAPDIELKLPKQPFEIILRNLIANSIKHHDQKVGKIEITYEQRKSMHVIHFADDGPGIPEELHDKAMEMFHTLKPRDKAEGSGMGLALVKRIVAHHEGEFFIKKGTAVGVEFIIHWPV